MIDAGTIKALLSEHQKYHSPFQIECFILDDHSGGTAYGFYRQCLREMKRRVRNIQLGLIETSRMERKKEELGSRARQIDLFGDPAYPGAIEDLAELQLSADEMALTLQEQWRELLLFYQHAVNTRKRLPQELTPEIRNQLDIQMWEGKIARRVELEKRTEGKLTMETQRMITHMPRESRKQLMNAMKAGTLLPPEYSPEPVNIDNVSLPPREEVEELCSNLKHLLTA